MFPANLLNHRRDGHLDRRGGWRARMFRDDRGLALIESIFVIPVVFAMIMGTLQVGLWWYARQVALTTAQQADRAARAYNASAADGNASATAYLRQVNGTGGGILLNPIVTVDRGAVTVTVQVHGHVPTLLPFLPSTVSAQAAGPAEQFEPPP